MDEPFLVVISLTMFMGSYLAGCIPLFFTLDEKRIRVVSMLGAGLLIGTALCVIIPEGVSTLVDSVQDQRISSHDLERIQPQNDLKKSKLLTENGKKQRIKRDQRDFNLELKQTSSMVPESSEGMSPHYQQFTKEKKNLLKRETLKKGENTKSIAENINEKEEAQNLDHSIGIPLLIGFLFMFVVDQISKMSHSRHKSLSTLGLVIHSFSDGIAMGSAAGAGSQTEMQILVFIAIMLHKAPAAFALVSILLSHGLEKVRIRRHLLVFSLAAPIATILTYAFLHTAQYEEDPSAFEGPKNAQGNSSSQLTGLILLFSAGTFLYVATVHVLPELIESKCSMSAGGGSGSRELLLMGGCGGNGVSTANSRLNLFEMLLFCISAMIPAFISFFNHGHGHK